MSSTVVFLIVIVGLVAAAAVFSLATARRRDTDRALSQPAPEAATDEASAPGSVPGAQLERASSAAPARSGRELERAVALERQGRSGLPDPSAPPPPPALPPDEETLGVTRRQVLNRGIFTAFALTLTAFGGASLAFLWPTLSGGFGAKIKAGKKEDILKQIEDKKEPFYLASGRFYINPYPVADVSKAKKITAYSAVIDGYQEGMVALYQKCVHLGCRVPWCKTSQWFECPCHGSQYNRVGEKKGGPAPRGLDRFVVSVDGGQVVVDTKQVVSGPPIGTNTTGQEAEGPHCVGGAAEK
ncbi:MAG: ubiquinol-cytochrome c reductase iron-sulfur subunit [Acidimicrobiales bacterium]